MSKNTTQRSVSTTPAGEKPPQAGNLPAVAPTPPLATAPPKDTSAPDPFDPARFRLSHQNLTAVALKKMLTTIPVRKPSKEQFIRCHPDEAYRIDTLVLELKEDREVYLIDPSLWSALDGESTVSPRRLITAQTRQGVLFLWPIRLPGPDGRLDDWSRSAMEAATLAMTAWVRVQSNMSLGAYEVFQATGDWDKPQWDIPAFNEVLKVAFRDKVIDNCDHPVLRRVRGEA